MRSYYGLYSAFFGVGVGGVGADDVVCPLATKGLLPSHEAPAPPSVPALESFETPEACCRSGFALEQREKYL